MRDLRVAAILLTLAGTGALVWVYLDNGVSTLGLVVSVIVWQIVAITFLLILDRM